MSCHRFEAAGGMRELQYAMKMFRCGFRTIGDIRVEDVIDHGDEADGSAGSGSVEYRLEGGSVVMIRSSADEPVIEICVSAADGSKLSADMEKRICADIESIIYIDHRAGYCCE